MEMQHKHTVSAAYLHSADDYLIHGAGFFVHVFFVVSTRQLMRIFCFDCKGRVCPSAFVQIGADDNI